MRWIADTHALVWHLTDPRRLGKAARRAFAVVDRDEGSCGVPAVVLIEAALLSERGRLRIGPAQILDELAGHPGYAILPLDVQQALEFGAFPGIRDPWDRMILAAARSAGAKLLSIDDALDGFDVVRVWD